jgi:hypothetical protein
LGASQSWDVWVFWERYDGRPIGDVPWQPNDRKAVVQQWELVGLGVPRVQDRLVVGAETYQVVQWWEEAPGLLWSLQVRM